MNMDVEKTIEFLLGQQARFDAQLSQLTETMDEQDKRAAERAAEMDERHEKEMSDVRAVLAGIGYELRRGIRSSIEEHRRERMRRKSLDLKIDQLAVSVQALVDAMKKDRNGN